jgi:hypothetical protein
MITATIRNLLHVLGYPRLLTSSSMPGEYAVGALSTRISDESGDGEGPAGSAGPACQVFYPVPKDKNNYQQKDTTKYFRKEAVEGLADYTRQSAALLHFLHQASHPCVVRALPAKGCGSTTPTEAAYPRDNDDDYEKFPIVLFSHGLGGTYEMYTTLCSIIASYGYVVWAVEHADGSAVYAQTEKGRKLFYQRPDDTPYSRQKVTTFRRPFLEHRVEEMNKVLHYLQSTNLDQTRTTDAVLNQVLQVSNTHKNIHLVGHSFGAASMVKLVQSITPKQHQHNFQSLSLLDCWAFSLDDKTLQHGCGNLPTLSILSEAWLTNPETKQVVQLLQQSQDKHQQRHHHHAGGVKSYYCPHSVHTSFSDASVWLPRWVSRRLGVLGTYEQRHVTIQNVASTIVNHMRQPGVIEQNRPKGLEIFSIPPVNVVAQEILTCCRSTSISVTPS